METRNSIHENSWSLFLKIGATIISLIFISSLSYSATRNASVSGNWNSTATWGGSAVPTSSDDVIINKDITVTVNITTAVAKSVTLNNNLAGTANLRFDSGKKLVVSGVVTLSGNGAGKNGILDMGSGGTAAKL